MTKVYFYGPVKGWSGKMGKLIFRQLPDGTTVVSRQHEKDKWEFVSAAQGKTIIAEAWDLPGHKTKSVL